jgi:hypothetical protein
MAATNKAKLARAQRDLRPPRGYAARALSIGERFDKLSDSVILTEPEVAQIVGYTPNTLKHWRLRGVEDKAPPSVRMPGSDAIRYRVADVRRWLDGIAPAPADSDPI